MTTFNTLQDMLDHYGAETPWNLGRSFYKYTDCGPWTVFRVPDKLARVDRAQVEVRIRAGRLVAKAQCSDGKKAAIEALSFCGFDSDGTSADHWSSLNAYMRRIDAFRKAEAKPGVRRDWTIERAAPCIGCVRLELARVVPATLKNVYYEDKAAGAPLADCVAVEIGSIVEGWGGELEPTTLTFPFTAADADRTLTELNATCSDIWDWANVTRDKLGRRHRNGKTSADQGMDCPI